MGTNPTTAPVTLGDLDREGKLLWIYCNDCGHEVETDPLSVPLPSTYPVPNVGKRMKCSKCGGRKISSRPELIPGGILAASK